jgi:hypothetical protein
MPEDAFKKLAQGGDAIRFRDVQRMKSH